MPPAPEGDPVARSAKIVEELRKVSAQTRKKTLEQLVKISAVSSAAAKRAKLDVTISDDAHKLREPSPRRNHADPADNMAPAN